MTGPGHGLRAPGRLRGGGYVLREQQRRADLGEAVREIRAVTSGSRGGHVVDGGERRQDGRFRRSA
ncbi:hypothetical protein ACFVYE_09755 [Streptomyces sp. NPDC058239]|uniref:hypothetical protein n=1 Tax=unclassified Streptomyces TaxID=2593676 RepID=UPI003653A511